MTDSSPLCFVVWVVYRYVVCVWLKWLTPYIYLCVCLCVCVCVCVCVCPVSESVVAVVWISAKVHDMDWMSAKVYDYYSHYFYKTWQLRESMSVTSMKHMDLVEKLQFALKEMVVTTLLWEVVEGALHFNLQLKQYTQLLKMFFKCPLFMDISLLQF